MKKRNRLPLQHRELLTAGEVGDLYFNKGRSTIYGWLREELIPGPIMVAGNNFWRRRELDDWILDGCPNTRVWRWEPMQVPSRKRVLRLLEDQQEQVHRETREIKREAEAELVQIKREIMALRQVRGGL